MGYDQYVHLRIRKDGADAKTLRIALNLSFPEFSKNIGDVEEKQDGSIYIILDGKAPLYEKGGILFDGEVNLKEISEELECTVEVYYEGEEKGDAEMITFVRGAVTEHKVLGWVDAPNPFGGHSNATENGQHSGVCQRNDDALGHRDHQEVRRLPHA